MSALPVPQPQSNDEPEPLPITPEIIGKLVGVNKRKVTKKDHHKIDHISQRIRKGYIIIKIDDDKVTNIFELLDHICNLF